MHADFSQKLENDGIKVTMIHAGAHKVDGNPFQALPDDVRAAIQANIDHAYGRFVAHVAKARGLSEADVRGTEARVFRGEEAVKAGLADKVMGWADSQAEFVASVNGRQAKTQRGARSSGPRASMETKMDPETALAAAQGLSGITALTVVGSAAQATAVSAALAAIGCKIAVSAVAAAGGEDVATARTQASEAATAAERTRVTALASLCPETTMSAGLSAAIEGGTSAGDFAIGLAQAAKTRGASIEDLRAGSVDASQLPLTAKTETPGGKPPTGQARADGILAKAAAVGHRAVSHLKIG